MCALSDSLLRAERVNLFFEFCASAEEVGVGLSAFFGLRCVGYHSEVRCVVLIQKFLLIVGRERLCDDGGGDAVGREHNHGHGGMNTVPSVVFTDEFHGTEEKVVERALQGLLHCKQFSLVASAVVVLAFAGHSADKVGVCVVGVAEGIGCHVDVVGIVASFLAAFDIVHSDVAYLVPGRVDIIAGNPSLAGVVHTRHKVADVLFLFLDSCFDLNGVCDALLGNNLLPVAALNFYLVLDGGVVSDFRHFGSRNQALLKIRPASEHGGEVGCRVVLTADGRESEENGELALGGTLARHTVRTRFASHPDGEVSEGVGLGEQGDAFNVRSGGCPVLPICIIHILDSPFLVSLGESAEARVLVGESVDARTVAGENHDAHREEKVLHVGRLFQEERGERVAAGEAQRVRMFRLLAVRTEEAKPCAVTSEHIKELILRGDFVAADEFADSIRQLVVRAPRHIEFVRATRHGARLHPVVIEDARGVLHGGHCGLYPVLAKV